MKSKSLNLSFNALQVLEKRYLLRDENRKIIESPEQLFRRVAKAVASAEKKNHRKKLEKKFNKMLSNLDFLPNTPTLMNAGTSLGQLSACFVLPVQDSMESIFNSLKALAIIQQSGGGTGFNFSHLRPEGEIVQSTKGTSSGPVSFMEIFNKTTDVVKQGGKRRGANMGILRFDHPDIEKFIEAKKDGKSFSNFNLSVAVTNEFMEAVQKKKDIDLINPRTKKLEKKINAKKLFDLIVENAWLAGDPGLIFLDEINKHNPTPFIGGIESTNPCGEQPLLSYESCNLGSINLANFVERKKVDFEKLKKTIQSAVNFLDNVIDVNKYPLKQIENITKANRKIGLGVMGWSEMLFQLEIPYNSIKALDLAEKLMKFIRLEAMRESIVLAKQKGSFPNLEKSIYKDKFHYLRNATITTIAPTGTISIIAGCSSGIEPLFAVTFVRNILDGTKLLEINPFFEAMARKRKFYSEELMTKIAGKGSIQGFKEIPRDVKKVFATAMDVKPEWHVKMQAAFQKYTDNAVSKTINFSKNASKKEIEKAFMLAWKLKVKGITVYRDKSKKNQVLSFGKFNKKDLLTAPYDFSGGCPHGFCTY